MVEIFKTDDLSRLLEGTRKARAAINQGELIVLPTDTVYGVAADAFKPDAVAKLLAAKGRTRQNPPPVLVADINAVGALAAHIPESIHKLAEAFWPGPLTVILPSQPSLDWDLGDTSGTVALRIPNDHVALEILRETGPLAVSSANLTGQDAAKTAQEAEAMIGDEVQVIIDAGATAGGVSSTIVDATRVTDDGGVLRVLRTGPISLEDLADACPELTVALAPKAPKPAVQDTHEEVTQKENKID